jgi:hypothetical protein
MTRTRRRIATILAAVAVLAAGCGGGGSSGSSPTPTARPSSPAKLAIVKPTNGEVVHGTSTKVVVSLQGARIVKPTTTHIVPTKGHVHVLLDGKIVSMNYGLTETLGGLTPGNHVLQVEFVASDHLPFDPRVIAAVTFQVKS